MTSRKLKLLCTTNLWKSDPDLSPEVIAGIKKQAADHTRFCRLFFWGAMCRGEYGDGTGEPVGRRSGREDNSDPSDFSDDSDKVGEKVLKGRWNGDGKCGRNCRRAGGTVTVSAEETAEGPMER